MKSPHILLTGGAGFIGSHVSEVLLAAGCRITVVDDLSSGTKTNLPEDPAMNFQEHDILQYPEKDWPTDIDVIVHLAAIPSVAQSWIDLKRAHEVNVSATVHLLEVARRLGIGRFVFASSAAVYGNPATLPLVESSPTVPLSPYGLQKLASEQYGSLLSRETNITFVALRFFNVYGPRQSPSSSYSGVITAFAEALRNGSTLTLRGDGRQTRDFVYVKDVARAVATAACDDLPEGEFRASNIGSGHSTTILELAETMRGFFPGSAAQVAFGPLMPGEIRDSRSDIACAQKMLGFIPRWSLHDGLADLFRAS